MKTLAVALCAIVLLHSALPAQAGFFDFLTGGSKKAAAADDAAAPTGDGGVVVLTGATYADAVASGKHFIKFYAPWCGHCKKLAPTWDELAADHNGKGSVTFAKMDCTDDANRGVCNKHSVQGFPTLKLVEGEESAKYTGARTAEAIAAWAQFSVEDAAAETERIEAEQKRKQAEEEAAELASREGSDIVWLTDQTYGKALAKTKHFVKFYAPWCGHCKKLAPTWDELATKMKKADAGVVIAKIDCTKERKACKKYGVKGFPTLKLIQNNQVADYNGARTLEALEAFAMSDTGKAAAEAKRAEEAAKAKEAREKRELEEARRNTAVVYLGDDDFDAAVKDKVHFVKFFAPWCGHCKALAPTWEDLAKKFNKEAAGTGATIAKVDCTSEGKAVCGKLGVRGYPTLKLIQGDDVADYKGGRTLDELSEFATKDVPAARRAAEEAEAAAKKKAEEEAAAEKAARASSSIVWLGDDDFEEAVAEKPHFVKFYAPWCGHCKALAPTWEELATAFNKEDPSRGATIAKVDCTAEGKATCSKYGVRGFPTLKLIHGEEEVKYEGGRTLEPLAEFAEKDVKGAAEAARRAAEEAERKAKEEAEKEAAARASSDIVWLSDDTFEDAVAAKPHFVKFYAPWCGHCKALAPTWEELATKMKDDPDEEVVIAKVDCTKDGRATCPKYEVKGFPTIKLIHGDKVANYEGARTLEPLAAFAVKDVAMAAREAEEAAERRRLKEEEDARKEAEARANSDAVWLDDKTFSAAAEEGKLFVKFYAPWCGHCKALAPDWDKLATHYNKENPGTVTIAKVDCTKERATCSKYEVRGFPTIVMIDGDESVKYEGARKLAELKTFAGKSIEGARKHAEEVAAEAARRAEEAAALERASREGSNIVWLDDETFDEAVAEKAHLVKFYAPWCGHCKALAPTWEELATDLKEDSDAPVVTKVECTSEGKATCAKYGVKGFPTIKLVKGDETRDYSGARTKDALAAFAEEGFEESDTEL